MGVEARLAAVSAVALVGSVLVAGQAGKWHKAGPRKELARGKLQLPAGAAFAKWGDVYVSSPIFGPGAIYRVR